MKDTNLQVQAQETLSMINTKKTTLFIVILLKNKTERKSGKHPDEDKKQ